MRTDLIRAIFTTNLGVRMEERVLVFTDRISEKEIVDPNDQCRRERLRDIALLTAEIGKTITRNVAYHEYPSMLSHGAEPPEELWRLAFGEKTVNALRKAGVLEALLMKEISVQDAKIAEAVVKKGCGISVNAVIALSNYSTSHTRFRDFLTRICRAKYASMPLFDVSMFEGSMNVDWERLSRRTKGIAKIVNRADNVEVKSPNGTHLLLSKKGRTAIPDTGILTRPGSFGNLPAGEVFFAPLEGMARGRLVLEWAPTRELDSPVILTVRNGFVVKVEGRESFAETLRAKLQERTENGSIAELGIGTNEKAKRPDNILESEKILGTIHIALGDNSSFGGTVKTPFHQDFVFFRPMVVLISKKGEKTTLMKEGKFIG